MSPAVLRSVALGVLFLGLGALGLFAPDQRPVKSVRGLGSYEFYVYATEWPPSACVFENCRFFPKEDIITIHGLWPSSQADNPFECEPFRYDESNIDPTFKPELYSRWIGLWKSHWDFIKYECRKHGTCWDRGLHDPARTDPQILAILKAFDPNDPFAKYNAYLKIAVFLNKKMDTFKLFRDNGVVPSDSATYPIDQFLSIVNSHYKLTSGLIPLCRKDKVSGFSYIVEFRYCLDLSYNPIDCDPMTVRRNVQQCGKDPLAYPPRQNRRGSSQVADAV